MATLKDVITVLEQAYPPELAESWDRIGLVCGDPDAAITRVMFAVDPLPPVIDDAIAEGVGLLVTHHPLLLRGVHTIAADTPKGNTLHRLVTAGIALYCAHTNADAADPGVSDALAAAIGLHVTGALTPLPAPPTDLLAVSVPTERAERVLAALHEAGAGAFGAYEDAASSWPQTGSFRPTRGANPAIGRVGELITVEERRLEVVLPRRSRAAVLAALHASHPYESPAYAVHELPDQPSRRGIGRVGELDEPEPFAGFVERVARGLPASGAGTRGAGDPNRMIRRVAVCGGAGDSRLEAATAEGVDAYVTADLRHHPVTEHLFGPRAPEFTAPNLVDIGHWASEWPWCGQAAGMVRAALGGTVETLVSTRRTDAWSVHVITERTAE